MNEPCKLAQERIITGCYFFSIAAFIGVIMRWGFINGFPLSFDHLLHAHSHMAMLSWLYLLITAGIISITKFYHPYLRKLLIWQVISSIIMCVGFLYSGYGVIAIVGSCLQMFGFYFFAYLFLKKKESSKYPLIKQGLYYGLFSTLGIYLLPISIVLYGKGSSAYEICIKFFLHFQMYGWMLSISIGLLQEVFTFSLSKKWRIAYNIYLFTFFGLTLYSYLKLNLFYYILLIGIPFQLYFVYFLVKKLLPNIHESKVLIIKVLLSTFILFIIGTNIGSLLLVNQKWAITTMENRNLIIFYIHWILIGLVMIGTITSLLKHNTLSNRTKTGWYLFLLGYLPTEFILLLLSFPSLCPVFILAKSSYFLFVLSLIMLIGILKITFEQTKSFLNKV